MNVQTYTVVCIASISIRAMQTICIKCDFFISDRVLCECFVAERLILLPSLGVSSYYNS